MKNADIKTNSWFKPKEMVRSITASKKIKIIFLATLVTAVLAATATATSLNVNVENQVKETPAGEAAHFLIDVENVGNQVVDVEMSVGESELRTSFSDIPGREFSLNPGEEKTANLLVATDREDRGSYAIPLYVNDIYRPLSVNVMEGIDALELRGAYEEITVSQGSSQELKFVAENMGNQRIENIVIDGNIDTKLNPEYPRSFFLNPGERRDMSVMIDVPSGYPTGREVFEIKGASGGTIGSTEEVILNIVDSPEVEGRLGLEAMRPWESLIEDGETVGYKVTFQIENKGLMDIQDVEWDLQGVPADWNVSGDESFDISGGETIQKTLEFHTDDDFSERELDIGLVKDDAEITREKIEFSGERIGVAVGGLVVGRFAPISVGIGIFVGFLIAMAFYMRRKEGEGSIRGRDSDYLKRLVDETLEREMDEENIEEKKSEENKRN